MSSSRVLPFARKRVDSGVFTIDRIWSKDEEGLRLPYFEAWQKNFLFFKKGRLRLDAVLTLLCDLMRL